jgi:hypothetical protein
MDSYSGQVVFNQKGKAVLRIIDTIIAFVVGLTVFDFRRPGL